MTRINGREKGMRRMNLGRKRNNENESWEENEWERKRNEENKSWEENE